LQVFELLRDRIALSIPRATQQLGLTWPTVNSALKRLVDLGIAREIPDARAVVCTRTTGSYQF
jgi:hypothetical protein